MSSSDEDNVHYDRNHIHDLICQEPQADSPFPVVWQAYQQTLNESMRFVAETDKKVRQLEIKKSEIEDEILKLKEAMDAEEDNFRMRIDQRRTSNKRLNAGQTRQLWDNGDLINNCKLLNSRLSASANFHIEHSANHRRDPNMQLYKSAPPIAAHPSAALQIKPKEENRSKSGKSSTEDANRQWELDEIEERNLGPEARRAENPSDTSTIINDCHQLHAPSHDISTPTEHQNLVQMIEKMKNEISKLKSHQVKPELPQFSGNPIEWRVFKHCYDTSSKEFQFSDAENLQRLHKCLTDDAKKAVWDIMTTHKNLPSILNILEKRFGSPELITGDLKRRLMELPSLHDGQTENWNQLSNLLQHYIINIEGLESECDAGKIQVENQKLLNNLIPKLPNSERTLWNNAILSKQIRGTLREFSHWVSQEREVALLSEREDEVPIGVMS